MKPIDQDSLPHCTLPDGSFCTLCCHLIISDVLKNGVLHENRLYQRCEHLVDGSCNVYDERSDTCRGFDCQNTRASLLKQLYTIARLYGLNKERLPEEPPRDNKYFRGVF